MQSQLSPLALALLIAGMALARHSCELGVRCLDALDLFLSLEGFSLNFSFVTAGYGQGRVCETCWGGFVPWESAGCLAVDLKTFPETLPEAALEPAR